ncbi:MAG: hypothetical protein KF770_14430 [Anaerolineae bacterium]|nr:hypothetical protein [Anaerolineae bacterium]
MNDKLTFHDPLAEVDTIIHMQVGKPQPDGTRLTTIAIGTPGQIPALILADLADILETNPTLRQAWLTYGSHAELMQTQATAVPDHTNDEAEEGEESTDNLAEAETAVATPGVKPKPRANLDPLF